MALKTLDLAQFTSPITVDEYFVPAMMLMDTLLEQHQLKAHPNQTGRTEGAPVPGAIVKPASHSNHLVWCAIDLNLVDPITGHVFMHSEMQGEADPRVKAVITNWEAAGNRWGGEFHDHDAVHFDSGLYEKNPVLWQQKFDEYQNHQ